MTWRAALFFATPTASLEYDVTVPGLGVLQGTARMPSRDNGKFAGTDQYPDLAQFFGIPYATPPIGDLRWQPPQPYGAWESPRDATKYGHACVQKVPSDTLNAPMSEDCLFLNVVAPQKQLTSVEKLPVMFWIHGGSYRTGEAADYALDAIVAHSNYSIVAAATNYRLGPFGFLGGQDVQGRTSDGSTGNFGIQDQRLAMSWVKDNIAAFGGDGTDITIFGESAGGNSVMNHLAQPASFSLYNKAIMESGAYSEGAKTMATADGDFKSVLTHTKCADLDCAVAAPAATINDLDGGSIDWAPVIDGVSLTATPWHLIVDGKHNTNARVVMGSNRDEMFMITNAVLPKHMGEGVFDAVMAVIVGAGDVQKVKDLYDPTVYDYPSDLGEHSQWFWMATDVLTDTVPGLGPCGHRTLARNLLGGGSTHVHTYLFSKASLAAPIFPQEYFVGHAGEIPFAFGDESVFKALGLPKSEQELAVAMSAYWTSFAIKGDPNHDGLPQWPLYEPDDDTVMRFDDSPKLGGVHTEQALRNDACDYWDAKATPSYSWDELAQVLRDAVQPSQQHDVVV